MLLQLILSPKRFHVKLDRGLRHSNQAEIVLDRARG